MELQKKIEFSIIIPVYNRERIIVRAIESVISQTFRDWELLIVDDCSTDNTFFKISSIKDPRIRVMKLLKNSGAASARNFGIHQSKGKLICFLDSDDELLPTFLEESFIKMNSISLNVAMIWTGSKIIRDIDKKHASLGSVWKPNLRTPYLSFLSNLSIGTNSGITIRREVFDRVGLFDEELPAAEDTDLFFRISREYSVDYIDKLLINIYQTGNDRLSKRFDKIAIAYNQILPKHINEIQKYKHLRLKFYYKLMWLNYHLGNKKLARYYFKLSLKNNVLSFKTWSVFIIFEILDKANATKLHILLSGLARG